MRSLLGSCSLLVLLAAARPADAAEYYYVDWTEADVAGGTATGTITLPDDSVVTVEFEAITEGLEPGNLYAAQVSGGTNYWVPAAPYESDEVENAPPDADILQLSGGQNQTYIVTLSEEIKDPIMALVSLGTPALETSYDFDAPFTIVSQGEGWWGGDDTSLSALDGDVLSGHEGHGTVRFVGTFAHFSWVVPTPETWHGFTFGIRTTERIEPTPTEGGAGGAGGESGAPEPSEGGSGGVTGSEGGDTGLAESGAGGAVDTGSAGEGGTSAPQAGSAGDSSTAAGESSGGVPPSTGGSAGEPEATGGRATGGRESSDGGSSDDDDESTVSCSCTLPGSSTGGLGIPAASLALAGFIWLRRRNRAR